LRHDAQRLGLEVQHIRESSAGIVQQMVGLVLEEFVEEGNDAGILGLSCHPRGDSVLGYPGLVCERFMQGVGK
jgi:hypothetical protein